MIVNFYEATSELLCRLPNYTGSLPRKGEYVKISKEGGEIEAQVIDVKWIIHRAGDVVVNVFLYVGVTRRFQDES